MEEEIMKLFMVNGLTIRDGEPYSLIVAETAEEAERIFISGDEDHCIMSAYAWEVTEVDGYKVVFKKGKKIVLE